MTGKDKEFSFCAFSGFMKYWGKSYYTQLKLLQSSIKLQCDSRLWMYFLFHSLLSKFRPSFISFVFQCTKVHGTANHVVETNAFLCMEHKLLGKTLLSNKFLLQTECKACGSGHSAFHIHPLLHSKFET